MPRNAGGDYYYLPPGTEAAPDTVIESARYNIFTQDVEDEFNRIIDDVDAVEAIIEDGVGSAVIASDTPPADAQDGDLWFESDTGLLFYRYNDGNSSQWCIACPQADLSLYVRKTGDTMTGDLTAPNLTATVKVTAPFYTSTAGLPLQFGGGALAGFYTDTTNIAIRASVANGNIYLQNNAGTTTYGIFGTTGLSSVSNLGCATINASGTVTCNGITTIYGQFNVGAGTIAQAGGGTFMIQGAGGGNEAFFTFHRPGAFACNFGLGSDGNLWYGGWSFGAGIWHRIWTTKDFAGPPSLAPYVTNGRLAFAADYSHSSTMVEPYPGSVVVGNSIGTSALTSRYRWVQLLTTSWFTIGTA